MIGIALLFAAVPTFGQLPVGKPASRPKAAPPSSIAASEQVTGFRTAAQNVSFDGGCILQDDGVDSRAWTGVLGTSVLVVRGGARAMHGERLVDVDADTAKIETTDAWLDPNTHGLRLITRSSYTLRRLGTLPGGTRVFAARDDDRKTLDVVVAMPKGAASTVVVRTDGTRRPLGQCTHDHISLATTAPGTSVAIELRATLPPLAPGQLSDATPLASPLTAEERKNGVKETRTRVVRASFGVSQTSRDKEPLVAFAAELVGPELRERTFDLARSLETRDEIAVRPLAGGK